MCQREQTLQRLVDQEVVQVLTLLDDHIDFAYSEPVLFTALPTSQLYAEADKPSHR